MKRTKHAAIAVILVVILVAALVAAMDLEQFAGSVGRCVVTDSGACLLILDGTPVQLFGSENLFRNLTTGDKLFVIHDGIRETWPAQTDAVFCLKIGTGSAGDIPRSVLDGLTEYGWLSE